MDGQTRIVLFILAIILLIVWIFKERLKLREMAHSHEKRKLVVITGVAAFIAVLNSIVFSLFSIIILDSIEVDRIIGNIGMYAAIVFVPAVPSGLMSAIILKNRRWISLTILFTLLTGLYIVLSCFYCIGSI